MPFALCLVLSSPPYQVSSPIPDKQNLLSLLPIFRASSATPFARRATEPKTSGVIVLNTLLPMVSRWLYEKCIADEQAINAVRNGQVHFVGERVNRADFIPVPLKRVVSESITKQFGKNDFSVHRQDPDTISCAICGIAPLSLTLLLPMAGLEGAAHQIRLFAQRSRSRARPCGVVSATSSLGTVGN